MEKLIKKQWPKELEGYKETLTEFKFEPKRGVYFLFDNNELVYIGKANDIYSRVRQHSQHRSFDKIHYIPLENDIEIIETQLIQHFRPRLNIADNPDNQRKTTKTTEIPTNKPSIAVHKQPQPKYKLSDFPAILANTPEDILLKVLDTLSDIEKDVLIKRQGLLDTDSLTLQSIGDQYELTRERIRQIQKKAERKMQHPLRINKLLEYTIAPTTEETQ